MREADLLYLCRKAQLHSVASYLYRLDGYLSLWLFAYRVWKKVRTSGALLSVVRKGGLPGLRPLQRA